MVLNPEKCHYLLINKGIGNESVQLDNRILHVEAEKKLFCIVIDKNLNSQNHKKQIIKSANQKLNALIRVAQFVTDFNKKVLFNSFIKGQSNYCSLH